MYQTIGEKVSVAGVYQQGKFSPRKILWGNRTYDIDQVTFISDEKDGGVAKRTYSIVARGNVYRLAFNRSTEIWTLMEVWYEG